MTDLSLKVEAERRKMQRVRVHESRPVSIHLTDWESKHQVLDISPEGARIQLDENVDLQESYFVNGILNLPGEAPLDIIGEIRHIFTDAAGKRHCGLLFLDNIETKMEKIGKYIESVFKTHITH